jgi:hypothetical protein
MNIHCVHCGHNIQLGDAYDAYSGLLRCSVCKQLMKVRIERGQLRSMEPAQAAPAASPAAQTPQPQ